MHIDRAEKEQIQLLAKILKEHLDQPAWKADALARADDRYEEHIKANFGIVPDQVS